METHRTSVFTNCLKKWKSNNLLMFASEALIVLFWYLVFFPGRVSVDSEIAIQKMNEGYSTGTGTAIYFRYLQWFSANGELLFLISFINIWTFYFATSYFFKTITKNEKQSRRLFLYFLISPFFGFFGGMIMHEIQFVSGALILLALLKDQKLPRSFRKIDTREITIALAGILLVNCRFDGILVTVLFIFMFFMRRIFFKILISSLVVLSLVFQSQILQVEKVPTAFKLAPFIGDLKCIVQDPISEIDEADKVFLKKIAGQNYARLFIPTPCNAADYGFFIFDTFEMSGAEFIRGYLRIAIKNPLLTLYSHVERSRLILPPFVFRSPPNMYDFKDEASAFPANTRPGLLHTLIIPDVNEGIGRYQEKLQSLLNLFAYLINQRTSFWSWGGMWVTLILILSYYSINIINRRQWFIIFSHLGLLFFLMPSTDARYVLLYIIMGILVVPFQLKVLRLKMKK